MSELNVGVFGANGHTGRFVAAELKRRGLAARWVGRDHKALIRMQAELDYGEVRAGTIDDPSSLTAAFNGLSAVINCAGPFLATSTPVIAAALDSGSHYLDVTAEQATVRNTIERWDAPAKAAGRVVMPAMGFFGGLADLLATSLLDGWSEVDLIETAVALDFWHPTAGTRLTGEQNTAPRVIVRGGEFIPAPVPSPAFSWLFPEPFGTQPVACVALSEIVTLSRHLNAAAITSFMTLKPLTDLADDGTPPPSAVDADGRSAQQFAMSVRVTKGQHRRETTVQGRDIYGVTAPLVVEACSRLLSAIQPPAGVRTPGESFDAADFLDALRDDFKPCFAGEPTDPKARLIAA